MKEKINIITREKLKIKLKVKLREISKLKTKEKCIIYLLFFVIMSFSTLLFTGCNKNEYSDNAILTYDDGSGNLRKKNGTNEDGTKIQDVDLEYQTLFLNKDASGERIRDKKIEYPEFKMKIESNDYLNQKVKEKARSIFRDIENRNVSEIKYEIAYYDNRILSILFKGNIQDVSQNDNSKNLDMQSINSKGKEYLDSFNYDLNNDIVLNIENYFGDFNNNIIKKIQSITNVKLKGKEKMYFSNVDGKASVILYYFEKENDSEYKKIILSIEDIGMYVTGNI